METTNATFLSCLAPIITTPRCFFAPLERLALVDLADALAITDIAVRLVFQMAKVEEELLVFVHPHGCHAHVVDVEIVTNVHVFQLWVNAKPIKLEWKRGDERK